MNHNYLFSELIELIQERISLSNGGWTNFKQLDGRITEVVAVISNSEPGTERLSELLVQYLASINAGFTASRSNSILQKMKNHIVKSYKIERKVLVV